MSVDEMRIRLLLWTGIPSGKQEMGEISTLQVDTKVFKALPAALPQGSGTLRRDGSVTSEPADVQGGVSCRPARERHALSGGRSLVHELLNKQRGCREEEKW